MPCTQDYNLNQTVVLEPRQTSYPFVEWIGPCASVSGNRCTVLMDQAKEVTAVFSAFHGSGVNVNASVTGEGTISTFIFASSLGFACPPTCSTRLPTGIYVIYFASPRNANWRAESFTINGQRVVGNLETAYPNVTRSVGVTMNANTTISANFVPVANPTLSVRVTGVGEVGNGDNTYSCSNRTSPCTREYSPNQSVTLFARSTGNYPFLGWIGPCTNTIGNQCTVLMDQAKEVTAAFAESINLFVRVTGEGAITSSPTGISCSSSAGCNALFPQSQAVTLTPIPAEGSRFSYWSGACTGTGPCTVTMSVAKSVTATFVKPVTVGNFTEFVPASANSDMTSIAQGPDGNLWVTQRGAHKIAKVTLDGSISEYDTPTRGGPYDIASGSSQDLWFTYLDANKVGRTTIGGSVTDYNLPVFDVAIRPSGISVGADGNMWIAEQNAHAISRIRATGDATRFSTPAVASAPRYIAMGHDGSLWFTESLANKIGRITTAGVITEFTLPTENAGIGDIARGPDGAMWFIEEQSRKIGRITMDGVITEFAVANTDVMTGAHITAGPDGNVWFTYGTSARLGQITASGTVTEYNTLSINGTTRGIATGSDGNIWYTDSAANKVGRLTLRPVRQGAVFSTAQDSSRSFLRFANTGTAAGRVGVSLLNPTTGALVNYWTSASIAPNASAQIYIDTIEKAGNAAFAKPQHYSVAVWPHMEGYVQHVLWKPSDGTLTNLSTCDTGVTATQAQLLNVHSTLLDQGYPSAIAISNTGSAAASAQLGIYDAVSGSKLGAFTTSSIAAGGQVTVDIAALEAGAGVSPGASLYHYVIKVENNFTGYLQHLLNNKSSSVITDMTTVCSLHQQAAVTRSAELKQGSVFASVQPDARSYVRFYNTGTAPGAVTVSLANALTGAKVRDWTSAMIPAGASHQIFIKDIEGASAGSADKYVLTARAQFDGAFQHILWRPADGTLTNLTTCNASVAADARQLMNVHSSLLSGPYPSSVVVNNTTAASARATIGIFDATTGARLGTYSSGDVGAGGHVIVPIDEIEAAANINPGSTIYHYVLKLEGSFSGYLQHLVNNKSSGVITDMTTTCLMKAA
jgi:virginiamycin B lyase